MISKIGTRSFEAESIKRPNENIGSNPVFPVWSNAGYECICARWLTPDFMLGREMRLPKDSAGRIGYD